MGCFNSKSKHNDTQSPKNRDDLNLNQLCVFEFEELRNATNDFNGGLKIKEGEFSSLYKGFLRPKNRDGELLEIAVRRLKPTGFEDHTTWLEKVFSRGEINHPNFVNLIGYCDKDGEETEIERLLVYEFMPNRTLQDHLFDSSYWPLSWDLRLRIILGVAEGLAYFHEQPKIRELFGCFKTSNILLDNEFKPKISDFGFAREGLAACEMKDRKHWLVSLSPNSYEAPEHIMDGLPRTAKSDVFNFGLVLYELITGQQAYDRNCPGKSLMHWVNRFPHDDTHLSSLIDPRLGVIYPLKGVREVARLAERCVVVDPKDRPKMSEVVESLRRIARMPWCACWEFWCG